MYLEIAIFLSLLLLLVFVLNRKPDGLPPGEWGLPIIGKLPPRGKKFSEFVKKLHVKYGNTVCLKMGTRLFVHIADFQTIKSALGKIELTGRPDFFTFRVFNYFRNVGLISSEGEVWSTNRRFSLRVLKDFGLGKSRLEDVVDTEVKALITELKTKAGKPAKIDWSLNVAVLNVIWGLVADKRFDLNDQEIHTFSKLINADFEDMEGPVVFLNIFPYLYSVLPRFVLNWMKVNNLERNRDRLIDYLRNVIVEHKKVLDKDNLRDYIDMYLVEMEKEKDNPESTFRQDYFDLLGSLSDLFVAGSETTSSTIRWSILYLAKHPEIQKKIQKEIDSVVPKDRFPSLTDKENLPYFEASVYEIQRCVSLVPTGVPHTAIEDVTLDGYNIPKGSVVTPSVEMCHQNPNYWERPDEFYPEHFINEQGKFYIRKEGFLPFSLGRRQCLGESLAKMELFLFLGAIIQNFTICEPEGQTLSLDPHPTIQILNYPQSFEVLLKNRE